MPGAVAATSLAMCLVVISGASTGCVASGQQGSQADPGAPTVAGNDPSVAPEEGGPSSPEGATPTAPTTTEPTTTGTDSGSGSGSPPGGGSGSDTTAGSGAGSDTTAGGGSGSAGSGSAGGGSAADGLAAPDDPYAIADDHDVDDPSRCIDPVSFGAIADDDLDDAPAFQRAIDAAVDAGAEVCVGPGVWLLGRKTGHAGSLELFTGPVTIRGAGAASVLRMAGDGQLRSWRGIYLRGAHDVVIRDLAIDGLAATNTEEQTHLAELGPDTHNVQIRRVSFGPMRQPDQQVGEGIGGDCLRFLGEIGHEVTDVMVSDSQFVDCDRSGIGVQRALQRITLVRDTISGTGDTAIDFEPTSRGAIDDFHMAHLTIHQPAEAQSAFAITITGIDQDLAHRVTLDRSVLEGGGVSLLNVDGAELTRNQITAHANSPTQPTVSVFRTGTNIHIAGNTIEDNTLIQATAQPAIGTLSVGGFTVRGNAIDYTAADPSWPVVQVSPDVADITGLVVEDNTVAGASIAVVRASVRLSYRLSEMSVRGNRSPNLAALRCSGPASSFGPVQLDQPLPNGTGCTGVAIIMQPMGS
jgi:hypothetical protein